jgi:oxygen-independent coproporphyrinogen-3 oxidase
MQNALLGNAMTKDNDIKHKELAFEFMLNALRLKEGFDPMTFFERTGLVLSTLQPGLQQAIDKNLLVQTPKKIKPTERGFDFLSDLQALFL